MKNVRFLSENFQFLLGKFSIYLDRRVYVIPHMNPLLKKGSILKGSKFFPFRIDRFSEGGKPILTDCLP